MKKPKKLVFQRGARTRLFLQHLGRTAGLAASAAWCAAGQLAALRCMPRPRRAVGGVHATHGLGDEGMEFIVPLSLRSLELRRQLLGSGDWDKIYPVRPLQKVEVPAAKVFYSPSPIEGLVRTLQQIDVMSKFKADLLPVHRVMASEEYNQVHLRRASDWQIKPISHQGTMHVDGLDAELMREQIFKAFGIEANEKMAGPGFDTPTRPDGAAEN